MIRLAREPRRRIRMVMLAAALAIAPEACAYGNQTAGPDTKPRPDATSTPFLPPTEIPVPQQPGKLFGIDPHGPLPPHVEVVDCITNPTQALHPSKPDTETVVLVADATHLAIGKTDTPGKKMEGGVNKLINNKYASESWTSNPDAFPSAQTVFTTQTPAVVTDLIQNGGGSFGCSPEPNPYTILEEHTRRFVEDNNNPIFTVFIDTQGQGLFEAYFKVPTPPTR